MGIAVSDGKLAKAVSKAGELGIVSGTAINSVLVRRLQDGDVTGDMRCALAAFPNHNIAQKILDFYFIDGGRKPGAGYKRSPLISVNPLCRFIPFLRGRENINSKTLHLFPAQARGNSPLQNHPKQLALVSRTS